MRRLAWPAVVFLSVAFYLPLLLIVVLSLRPGPFAEPGLGSWSLANYAEIFDPLYLAVTMTSLRIIAWVTIICLALAYPMAQLLRRLQGPGRVLFLAALLIPFFTNCLARYYALYILLKPEGVLAQILGLDIQLIGTETAMVVGLVSNYLPFMVFPIFFSLERIDPRTLEAARMFGCGGWQLFRRIVLPLTMPGVVTGVILVALPALGEFIVARMLGGGMIPMIAMAIEREFLEAPVPNWPLGSALCTGLLVAVLAGVAGLRATLRSGDDPLLLNS